MKWTIIKDARRWFAALGVAACLSGLPTVAQTYYFESFEGLPLGPNVNENSAGEKVWTKTPPPGWVQDDSGVPGVGDDATDGTTEWAGWSFADSKWWPTVDNQRRSEFTRASGTVMIADPDEWDDQGHADSAANGWYETSIFTQAIDISGAPANSLQVAFNSSWRPEFDSNYHQSGQIVAIYTNPDGSETELEVLLWLSDGSSPNFKDDNSTNEYLIYDLNNPAGAASVKLKFRMFDAGNDWWWAVDNVAVGQFPMLSGFDFSPVGFNLAVTEAMGGAIRDGSLQITLDGQTVQTSVSEEPDFVGADEEIDANVITVSYARAVTDPFTPNQTYVVGIRFVNASGVEITIEQPFVAPPVPVIPASFKAEGVNTGATGFNAHVTQSATAHGNSLAEVERRLDGITEFTDIAGAAGKGPISGPINFDQDGGFQGNFEGEVLIPGIPGTTSSTDNIAAEFTGYLQLRAGYHQFGVNSDDGFAFYIGANARDQFATRLGAFDGGRGAADTIFEFVVEEAGVYPMRLVWFEGGGGANVEFFSVDPVSGEKTLVNSGGNSVAAYREGPSPTYIPWVSPAPGPNAAPDKPIMAKIVPGDGTVNASTVKLNYDGRDVAADVQTAADGSITVTWTPGGFLRSQSSHDVVLTFEANGTGNQAAWNFTVLGYETLHPDLATPIGSATDRGMLWRVHQLSAGRGNSDALAEQQLAGELGESIHDPFGQIESLSGLNTGGTLEIDFVNFEQTEAPAGNFSVSATPPLDVIDGFIPGIPGLDGGNDNIAAEVRTFIEFADPGLYTMVVNSDDGFKVTYGNDTPEGEKWQTLGILSGGRGAADTAFQFVAPNPGVWFFRLIWYEGGGGASVEWFTRSGDGTASLVNGPNNTGLQAFRSRSAPEPGLPVITVPLPFAEDFNGLALGPNVDEAVAGDNVWTKTAPAGWTIDDSGIPGVGDPATDGVTEWAGWSFADAAWWAEAAEDQRRTEFTLATGAVAVADPDEWDDQDHADSAAAGWYDTFLSTPALSLAGVEPNAAVLQFDSSWRPEFDSNYHQTAGITVSFDGSEPVQVMLWESDSSSPNFKDAAVNETVTVPLNNPAGATSMVIDFGLFDAGNDWWWAIDNILVSPAAISELELAVDVGDNGQLTLMWSDAGARLQSAANVTGPWADVAGAASPSAVTPDQGQAFFRLVK